MTEKYYLTDSDISMDPSLSQDLRPSAPPFANLDPLLEQFGGGRQKSPPVIQTPTKLRTHIKPTLRDSGLVRKSAHDRAKLLDDCSHEQAPASGAMLDSPPDPFSRVALPQGQMMGLEPPEALSSERSMSRGGSPMGPHNPHSMQAAPSDIILPQLLAMQGQEESHMQIGRKDPPIRNVIYCPVVPEVYDFSSLDAQSWDFMAGFDIAQPATDHHSFTLQANAPSVSPPPSLNVPATHIIPPTPVKATSSTGPGLKMNTESGAALVGRRSEETNAVMEKQFEFIDGAINELVASTGIPAQQVLNLFLKSRGRIQNATNHWNIYGQYFKMFRLQELERAGKDGNVIITSTIQRECYECFWGTYPDSWQEILDTFNEARTSSGPPLTVAQRSQEFAKLSRKVTTLLDSATAKHGFEGALIMCGKVVNQDASIGYIHTTPGAEEFWATHCRADEDTMIGHFKSHVYHLASLAVVGDAHSEDLSSEIKSAPKQIAQPGRADALEATHDDQEAREAPDNTDWRILPDDLQCIRIGTNAMFSELGGRLTARSGTFPWKNLPKELARHRFIMIGYPEDTLMPGEPRVTVARSKGISDLDKREQRVLADAMRSGNLSIRRQKKADLDKESPVVLGEAPSADSVHIHGRHMLIDGTIDREGLPRLKPIVAITKVKPPKSKSTKAVAFRASPSTEIEQKPPPSRTIVRKQRLVPVVELPARPPPSPPLFDPKKVKRRIQRPTQEAPAATREVISINMSSEPAQESLDEDEDDSDSEYDDATGASHKRKMKRTGMGSRFHSRKRRIPSSDIEVIDPSYDERKGIKGKGKEKQAVNSRMARRYLSVTGESDSEQEKLTERKALHPRDGPSEGLLQQCTQHERKALHPRDGPSEGLLQQRTQRGPGPPKPKMIVPGSSQAARQTALYFDGRHQLQTQGGSGASQEVPQACGNQGTGARRESPQSLAPREAPNGAHDNFSRTDRHPHLTTTPEQLGGASTKKPQNDDHLVPSLAPLPSSSSPQSHQPLHPLLPTSHDQRGAAFRKANVQQYGHDLSRDSRSLPAVPSHVSEVDYQPTTQYCPPPSTRIVNAAHQSQYSTDSRNDIYMPQRPPHHSYPMHAEPDAYERSAARGYREGRGASEVNAQMNFHELHAPVTPHQGPARHDNRGTYIGADRKETHPMTAHHPNHHDRALHHDGLDGWHPPTHYPVSSNNAKARCASPTNPLPGVMQYSSSPPPSEVS